MNVMPTDAKHFFDFTQSIRIAALYCILLWRVKIFFLNTKMHQILFYCLFVCFLLQIPRKMHLLKKKFVFLFQKKKFYAISLIFFLIHWMTHPISRIFENRRFCNWFRENIKYKSHCIFQPWSNISTLYLYMMYTHYQCRPLDDFLEDKINETCVEFSNGQRASSSLFNETTRK